MRAPAFFMRLGRASQASTLTFDEVLLGDAALGALLSWSPSPSVGGAAACGGGWLLGACAANAAELPIEPMALIDDSF